MGEGAFPRAGERGGRPVPAVAVSTKCCRRLSRVASQARVYLLLPQKPDVAQDANRH